MLRKFKNFTWKDYLLFNTRKFDSNRFQFDHFQNSSCNRLIASESLLKWYPRQKNPASV